MHKTTQLLIIDDEVIFRKALRIPLSAYFGIFEANTVAQALETLEKHRFSVVLVDCGLPDGSGLDLIARIKQMQPQTAIIMISGEAEVSLVRRAIARGAHDYVVKGENLLQELLLRVPMALERVQSSSGLPMDRSELNEDTYKNYLEHHERLFFERALELSRFEVSTLARALGLSRSTVHKRLSELGIVRKVSHEVQALTAY